MFHFFSPTSNPQPPTHLSWLFLVLLTLLTACSEPSPTPVLTPTVNPAEGAAKVDSVLRDVFANYQVGGLAAARDYARSVGLLDDQNRVRFALVLSTPSDAPALTQQITTMGGEVYATDGNQLAVAVEIGRLTSYFNNAANRNFFQELAAFKEVRELKFLLKPPQSQVVSQQSLVFSSNSRELRATSYARNGYQLSAFPLRGPAARQLSFSNHQSSIINHQFAPNRQSSWLSLTGADRWQKAGYQGRSVTVGIIDGGFGGWRAELDKTLPSPENVTFKSFLLGGAEGESPHGVAVAEVIHAVAPDARLILTPIEDEIGFVNAVQYLRSQKADIIQVSMGWAGIFPGDGTSRLSRALDDARKEGVLPVVSSGNYGEAHFSATFSPNPGSLHLFGENVTTLDLTALTNSAWVSLRWKEPWNAARVNLDLFVLDSAGKVVISSRNEQGVNNSPKPPYELAPFRTVAGQTYKVQVKLTGGTPNNLPFEIFAYNADLAQSNAAGSIATPADANGAISVGAFDPLTGELEPYSSQGPTSDGRPKPDFIAPTDVPSRIFAPFFTGTSAAAPQLAGLAALLKSAAPDLSADAIATYLRRQAVDTGAPGRDPATGFGKTQLGTEEAARYGSAELLGAVPVGTPFRDDFGATGSGLPNNTLGYYGRRNEGSAYFVSAAGAGVNWNSYLGRSWDEFRAEVAVTPPDAPGAFYGLIFWQQARDDYYVWLLSGDRYAVLRRAGTNWQTLLDWSEAAALRPALPANQSRAVTPTVLRLNLEATSAYLRLRVNDSILGRLALRLDTPLAPPARLGGTFGFVAGTFDSSARNNAQFAIFRDLVITPVSSK
jgi:hypothetical protein